MTQQKEKYIPTGNEMISISDIRESDASIMGITFLHMGYKGMIEIRGEDSKTPLLKPFIYVENENRTLENIEWERIDYWIPRFKSSNEDFDMEGTILAPIGERGFIYSLKIKNTAISRASYKVGLDGTWNRTIHEINESKDINADKYVYLSSWNNSIVMDIRSDMSIISLAPIFEEEMEVTYKLHEDMDKKVDFNITKEIILEHGEERVLNFYWGLGFEEVGSTTAAKEMLRKGFKNELDNTRDWLCKRLNKTGDMKMDKILNTNLFFNFFFASGITVDTEEFVLVTSRSPRYYVSAAYWDRDSLLWSFPSILLVDSVYAKEMLEYVFTKQIKNVGIHSRYIDGTVLEPGFELDELCAPIIALYNYICRTGDYNLINKQYIQNGIERILKTLESRKHCEKDLYETFLQPTDDMIVYPYLTYDNVLVWRMLNNIAELYIKTGRRIEGGKLSEKADNVKKAIMENCVVNYNGSNIFAWSLDLEGNWNVYDEPPGSLQLMPFYGFCDSSDSVYINTVREIRKPEYLYSFNGCNIAEIGCEHAPHPWILSVANSLLCGRKEHCRDILMKAEMDNGIACESIDENTGECTTGEAFATCAGFLAYAIYYAFVNKD